MAHRVTLIPGDGTGPELCEATRRVLEATGVDFDWDVQYAGSDVMDQYGGNPLPDQVLDAIRASGVALKGPITTPVGGGFRSVNVAPPQGPRPLRPGAALQELSRSPLAVRGRRPRDRPRGDRGSLRRDRVRGRHAGGKGAHPVDRATTAASCRDDSGISIKPISIDGTRRIVQFAFDYARRLGRRKVTSRAQGEHHEVHGRALAAGRARGRRAEHGHRVRGPHRRQPVACSSSSGPRSTTCSCCRTSTATSSPTSPRA